MAKILVVEDDPELAQLVSAWLKNEHHTVESVADGKEALERLKFYSYDVAILDWMLPGMNGPEVCREFRSAGGITPILMLTAKRNVDDKEQGLDSGADDYLTKPFELKELSARIRALLRRPANLSSSVLKIGYLELEPKSLKVKIIDQEIDLLPKEFALLQFFMRHPGQIFNAEALLDRVWASDSDASPEAVRTHIKRLRKKITVAGHPSLLSTVHGAGYKLEIPSGSDGEKH
jgi:DNA-binding response OmpR family regulator